MAELGAILNSGALILLSRIVADYPRFSVRICYREAGYDVEIYDDGEPLLRETAPVLQHALLAAFTRLLDEGWLRR
jgi:hypothetical protein